MDEPKPGTVDFASQTVKVLVGEKKKLFHVHESKLRSNSLFFDAALKKCWAEGKAREVKLPEEGRDVFYRYVEYLYKGILSYSGETADDDYRNLEKIYCLGQRLMDDRVSDAVLKALTKTWEETRSVREPRKEGVLFPGPRTINTFYGATVAGSPARRLFVDAYVNYGRPNLPALKSLSISHDFLQDLVKALLERHPASHVDQTNFKAYVFRNPCIYHHHPKDQACPHERERMP